MNTMKCASCGGDLVSGSGRWIRCEGCGGVTTTTGSTFELIIRDCRFEDPKVHVSVRASQAITIVPNGCTTTRKDEP